MGRGGGWFGKSGTTPPGFMGQKLLGTSEKELKESGEEGEREVGENLNGEKRGKKWRRKRESGWGRGLGRHGQRRPFHSSLLLRQSRAEEVNHAQTPLRCCPCGSRLPAIQARGSPALY